jgi:hypothetical protein
MVGPINFPATRISRCASLRAGRALDRSLLPHRFGENGIGGFADDPPLLCLGTKFAMDSLLEGRGFELVVPP